MTEHRDLIYDVAIVGAGVVGCAIAREMSRFQLEQVVIDAGPDVGDGTSKANTGILHTGFDAPPGTLEARLVRRGWELLREHAPELGIPVEQTGAILVAWNETELVELDTIMEKARSNGYTEAGRLAADELYRREPNLGPGALGGLEVPGEGIVCTFTTPLAFATQAVVNGAHLRLNSRVVRIARGEADAHLLVLENGERIRARWLVNAAGLGSDLVDRMLGHERFTVTPRRGELIVFDKLARDLISHIVLPVPTRMGKGVLVAPTVYGNVLLGPTAEDLEDRNATGTTAAGIDGLRAKGRRIVPALLDEEVTAIYAGLRAATEHSGYQIFAHPDQRYVCVGGIRSTGLTASMAIAEHVAGLLAEAGLTLVTRLQFVTVQMPNIGEAAPRPYRVEDAIDRDPKYGQLVCFCERVSRGEIRDATRAVIPARSIGGLGRRTRAGLGRCQGFFCLAELAETLAETTSQRVERLLAAPHVRGSPGRGQ